MLFGMLSNDGMRIGRLYSVGLVLVVGLCGCGESVEEQSSTTNLPLESVVSEKDEREPMKALAISRAKSYEKKKEDEKIKSAMNTIVEVESKNVRFSEIDNNRSFIAELIIKNTSNRSILKILGNAKVSGASGTVISEARRIDLLANKPTLKEEELQDARFEITISALADVDGGDDFSLVWEHEGIEFSDGTSYTLTL
mgnify:CR=1 FL=1